MDNTVLNIQRCVHYLRTHGIDAKNYESMCKRVPVEMKPYQIISIDPEFFTDLAKKLRELWPKGQKDGKYPWRGDVKTITDRLMFLWSLRGFTDKITVEDCLAAANRYLSRFETSTKYMQILKYFIFKQEKLVNDKGIITYTYKSTLADLLEDGYKEAEFEFEESFGNLV